MTKRRATTKAGTSMSHPRKKSDHPGERVRRYLASLPPDARRHIRTLRSTLRKIAPGAVEHFSYGIPAMWLDGKPLMWYAAWKEHVSIYPMGERLRRQHAARLKRYRVSKGTIQFPINKPLPIALIRQLVRGRIAELRLK